MPSKIIKTGWFKYREPEWPGNWRWVWIEDFKEVYCFKVKKECPYL